MIASGIVASKVACRRIEKFFGCPIWASERQWIDTNRAEVRLGLDPLLSYVQDVRARARELGIIGIGSTASVSDIIELSALLPDEFQMPVRVAEKKPVSRSAPANVRPLLPLPEKDLSAGAEKISEVMAQLRQFSATARDALSKFNTDPNVQ